MKTAHQPVVRRLEVAFLLGLASSLFGGVSFTSPGFAPSTMNDQARLVEDWGTLEVKLAGEGLASPDAPVVQAIKLDEVIPAAQAQCQYGPVSLRLTAFRAPVWPAGLDLLTVRLAETSGQPRSARLSLSLPETVRVGTRAVWLGGRTVMTLPEGTRAQQAMRDWGWADDAVSLAGWARPEGECDPAFRNIRAGLGGVPIHYVFQVEPDAGFHVVLGWCESHWAQAGQRPFVCQVEGSPPREVDPVANWGQHKPGALSFPARDENRDGRLEVSVLPKPGAPDQNPILNVIWIFPPGPSPNLDAIVRGELNGVARQYVDVGGGKDQSLYAGGNVEYAVILPANGTQELTFLVACRGGSVPMPDKSAWTPDKLQQAAAQVWRDWTAE